MKLHRPSGVLIVSLAILLAACDNDEPARSNAALTAPTPFAGRAPFVGASVTPAAIGYTWVPTFSCPLWGPFTSSFSVVIDQRGGADLFMEQAAFRFVDGSGLPSPLELTRADLTGMFGTTLVPSGTMRTFDFQHRYGCGFAAAPSSLSIDLSFHDRSGARHRRALSASLRPGRSR